jgi:uncharacterized protein YjcR
MENEEAGGKTPPEETATHRGAYSDDAARKFAEEYGWCERHVTLTEWAEKYAVHPSTIINWKKKYQNIIDRISEDRRKELAKFLISSSVRAAKLLDRQIDSLDERVAQGAASKLLDKVAATQTEAVIREAVDLSALTDEELEIASKLEEKVRDESP